MFGFLEHHIMNADMERNHWLFNTRWRGHCQGNLYILQPGKKKHPFVSLGIKIEMQKYKLTLSLLIFSLLPLSLLASPFVLVLSQDDLKDIPSTATDAGPAESQPEWDEFGDSDSKPEHELDPGSWRPIFEPDAVNSSTSESNFDPEMEQYYSAVEKMLSAVSDGEVGVMEESVAEIEELASAKGNLHAQSVLGFLYGLGQIKERNKAKAFLYHYFAAEGGNLQSKLAIAYTYYRQHVSFKFF